jgi:hypothetical protein
LNEKVVFKSSAVGRRSWLRLANSASARDHREKHTGDHIDTCPLFWDNSVRKSAYKKIRHGVASGLKNSGFGVWRSGLNGDYPELTSPMG